MCVSHCVLIGSCLTSLIGWSYRLLQISSFNGKMNALNEVNKVISSVSYYTHRHGNPEEEEWLTAERMAVRTHTHVFCYRTGNSAFWEV